VDKCPRWNGEVGRGKGGCKKRLLEGGVVICQIDLGQKLNRSFRKWEHAGTRARERDRDVHTTPTDLGGEKKTPALE